MSQSTHTVSTNVVGIDPGLVHTGVVEMSFYPKMKSIVTHHIALNGVDVTTLGHFLFTRVRPDRQVYIEGYRPRSHFDTDTRMTDAVAQYKAATSGQVLLNTGVKQVVRQPLMELLGVWKFPTSTHHQDLRSAARIALLGMLRDEQTNELLSDVVRDHLLGKSWYVRNY